MSWHAVRYEKRSMSFQDRSQANEADHSKKKMMLRADDQRMVARLVMETNERVKKGALGNIFGSSSVVYALRVALRIKRAKRRDATLLTRYRSVSGVFPAAKT